ncbi:MAG: HAD-IIB family hydrolase [Bacilli bacterium]|nr:HAD-IIB family hydrolase [Bacilli bacterium]
MKKVLFFDVDGTLLTPKKRIVEKETLEVLEELSKNPDIDLYLSSGRGRETLGDVEFIIPYFTGLNLANGGHIIINNESFLDCIDRNIVEEVVKFMINNKISFSASTSKGNLRMYFNDEVKASFDRNVPCPYTLLNENDDFYFDDVIQFWLLGTNEQIDEVEKHFKSLTFFKWGTFGADVIPTFRDKGTGIKKILSIMNYDINNTYAFGDSDNDVPMFKVCKTSVVMEKCTPKARDAATYITGPIEEGGLAEAVRKYVLNEKKA